MPHLICEYSSNHSVETIREIMQELHVAAAGTSIVRAEDLKIRAQPYDDYLFAGSKLSFFHLRFYLNVGRTVEQKKQLSIALLAVLTERLKDTVNISIDMREMENMSNSKRVLDMEQSASAMT